MDKHINYSDHEYFNISEPSKSFRWRERKQPIYRLLDNKQWLDNFFDKGEICLSCFINFSKYPDEIRGDKEEADGMVWLENTKGDTFAVKYQGGENCYVLCTTMRLNKTIINDFNAVGAIKIHNYEYFAIELMKSLQSSQQGISGKCNYRDSRVFNRTSARMISILDKGNDLRNPEFYDELLLNTCEHELFLKLNKYEYQDEFRLIWFAEKKVDESIIIECPEAIRHCERIDF